MTKQETLRKLFEENNLEKEDIFVMERGGKKIPIITRQGIEKIQAKHGINITFELCHISEDNKQVVIKATGRTVDKDGKIEAEVQTFGEASPGNNKNAYNVAMSEKRALSRCVLKLAGFYQHGIFAEEESEDFH